MDGVFEAEMEAAVKAFQEENELETTGVLTGDTAYAVMDELRLKIEKDDPQLLEAKKLIMEKAGIKAETTDEAEQADSEKE